MKKLGMKYPNYEIVSNLIPLKIKIKYPKNKLPKDRFAIYVLTTFRLFLKPFSRFISNKVIKYS